ncbi:MAG: hypothetical protein AAFP19_03285 [Bacteroidota bacterium]
MGFFFLSSPMLSAQNQGQLDYKVLLSTLTQHVEQGEKRALRDLGGLIDKKSIQSEVRQSLRRLTLFNSQEFDLNRSFDREDFMAFYYEHEHQFEFSELVKAFYLTPLNDQEVAYESQNFELQSAAELNLRNYTDRLTKALASNNHHHAVQALVLIQQIANLKQEESGYFLFELLNNKRFIKWRSKHKQEAYEIISKGLAHFQNEECLSAILGLLSEGSIRLEFARPLLAKMTNIAITESSDTEDLVTRYQYYIDSLASMEAMRAYGYNQYFNFRPNFFPYPVDYFGKILSESDAYPWIQYNAFRDLKASAHPRALFYIATKIFQHRHEYHKKDAPSKSYFEELKLLTRLEIGIKDSKGAITYTPFEGEDRQAKLNFLAYWSKYYEDYEWDENHNYYTNKKKAQEITQNYERLFRRLNSRNDSVAFKSFVQLTEGDPTEVIDLAEKYRQLLRTYNQTLPSFKHKYLEQLVLFTAYLRDNQFSYKCSHTTQDLLDQLRSNIAESDRYQLENELLSSLKLEELAALEYQACLYEQNQAFTFSIGRILDLFYSKKWERIISDDNQLLLYLKKSYLFAGLGVFGSCNYYLTKFDLSDVDLQERLSRLYKLESDEDILNQISQLMVEPTSEESYSLSEFLESPMFFDRRDIKILPAPNANDIRQIIKRIKNTDDITTIKQLFYYMRLHPSLELVPQLCQLIDDQRILGKQDKMIIKVCDYIIPSLEDIYNYSFENELENQLFATDKWRALWKGDGDNYRQWVNRFFEEKLVIFDQSETLNIDAINQITESPDYSPKYKSVCLKALKKVRPIKDIRQLIIEPALSVEEDLVYFEDFYFGYKELDDIPKLFEINTQNAGLMLAYLEEKSNKFSYSERGSFYNNLFRSPWFLQYINSGTVDQKITESIRDILNNYLDESDYLSEFEEQTTNLHIARIDNIGRPIAEQMKASIYIQTDEGSKAKIQEAIIAGIAYEDLSKIAHLFNELSVSDGTKPYSFLYRDFGIPIFQLEEQKAIETFIAQHQQLSEYDFYLYYLKEFGVDFLNKKDKLDFEKIYQILQFDIVSPFVSRSGGKRDYYTYGIIKLLELKFGTRLDFHEKLNENQTFYSFSSAKRAQAWMAFLVEKRLVRVQKALPASFSQAKREY